MMRCFTVEIWFGSVLEVAISSTQTNQALPTRKRKLRFPKTFNKTFRLIPYTSTTLAARGIVISLLVPLGPTRLMRKRLGPPGR